jgi:hypothetical protein
MSGMFTIYCIEDCNSLKYVGRTNQKLKYRLTGHKNDKKLNHYCSSSKLDLDNCEIYSLEKCNESNKKQREQYWINKIECVNKHKLNYNHNEFNKKYYQENKEKVKEYKKQWYQNNKEKHNKKSKLNWNKHKDETNLFRRKHVVNGCYEFIKMLDEY